MNVVLLPGLDGTGTLFAPFVRNAPDWATPVAISYDRDKVQDYEKLAGNVYKEIDRGQPFILVGESFSGPVALLVATRLPENLVGVVLCASFAVNPRPLMSLLYSPALLRALSSARVPAWAIRRYLTGRTSSTELVKSVASVIRSVPPDVLAARLKMVIEVDVTRQLSACEVPLLYVLATQDRLVSKRALAVLKSIRTDISVASV